MSCRTSVSLSDLSIATMTCTKPPVSTASTSSYGPLRVTAQVETHWLRQGVRFEDRQAEWPERRALDIDYKSASESDVWHWPTQ